MANNGKGNNGFDTASLTSAGNFIGDALSKLRTADSDYSSASSTMSKYTDSLPKVELEATASELPGKVETAIGILQATSTALENGIGAALGSVLGFGLDGINALFGPQQTIGSIDGVTGDYHTSMSGYTEGTDYLIGYKDGVPLARFTQNSKSAWQDLLGPKKEDGTGGLGFIRPWGAAGCSINSIAASVGYCLSAANGTDIFVTPADAFGTIDRYIGASTGKTLNDMYDPAGKNGFCPDHPEEKLFAQAVSDEYNLTVLVDHTGSQNQEQFDGIYRDGARAASNYSMGGHIVANVGPAEEGRYFVSDTRGEGNEKSGDGTPALYGTRTDKKNWPLYAVRNQNITVTPDYAVEDGLLTRNGSPVTEDIGEYTFCASNGRQYEVERVSTGADTYEYRCTDKGPTVGVAAGVVEPKSETRTFGLTKAVSRTVGEVGKAASSVTSTVQRMAGGKTTAEVQTQTDPLAIRVDTSTSSEQIGRAAKGSTVEVIPDPKNDEVWTRIKTDDGVEGYAHTEHLGNQHTVTPQERLGEVIQGAAQEIEKAWNGTTTAEVQTQTDPLAIRVDTSTSSQQVGRAPKGSTVEIIPDPKNDEVWTKVKTDDGTEGYVRTEYLGNQQTTGIKAKLMHPNNEE